MARQTETELPKLHFMNGTSYVPEYIPPTNFIPMNWVRSKYIIVRHYLGKDIYYWHIRHDLSPHFRKTSDLEFVQHVLLEHDQNPTDPVERRHFNRAWKLYGPEMKFFLSEMDKDETSKWKGIGAKIGHPYAYAYAEEWFEKNPEVEQKLLYHGVSIYDYAKIVHLSIERTDKRREKFYEDNRIDPTTGDKLPEEAPTIMPQPKKTKHVKNRSNKK